MERNTEMKPNNSTKPNNQNGLDCSTCEEGQRRRKKDLTCSRCYQAYIEEAGKALARGQAISLPEWVIGKAEERVAPLRADLDRKKAEYRELQQKVGERAFREIKTSLKGKSVPVEAFNAALRQKKDEFWKAEGGNRLHFEVKTLEKKTTFIEGLLSELRQKVADYAARAEAAEQAETVSPADADEVSENDPADEPALVVGEPTVPEDKAPPEAEPPKKRRLLGRKKK